MSSRTGSIERARAACHQSEKLAHHVGHAEDVESTTVDGRFPMRDHQVLSMDEEAIVAEADAVGRRIWAQVLEAGPVPVPRMARSS